MDPIDTRISFSIHDPIPQRGRRRSIYLTRLDLEVRPLEQEKVKLLLDIVFRKRESQWLSTNSDETP